jgi:hypothetical protein
LRPHKNKPVDNQKQIVVSGKEIIKQTKSSIRIIRGQEVILAADVALIYGDTTKRINERAKRHPGKFPPDCMFQLSKEEFKSLRSQSATSKLGRGGTKYLPYAFTEYGVLQTANLINTELADSVSVFVIRAFVEMRRTLIAQQQALVSASKNASKIPNVTSLHSELLPKLQSTIGRILESVIDAEKGTTIKDEA